MRVFLDVGALWKVDALMVDFDVRKIPGMEGEEADVLAELAAIGFDRFDLCENVMVGDTHRDRIANWLRARAPA